MSKIGRKPIELGAAKIEIKGNEIHFKGKLTQGMHVLDDLLVAEVEGNNLFIKSKKVTRDTNRLWGLHRALLANKIHGSETLFEKILRINGLGFKAILSGNKIQFSLGFSHKIDFEIPKDVKVEIDKTGQIIKLKSSYKDLLGLTSSRIRDLRPPEPYKGTGIMYDGEQILRKAGKTKAAK